MKPYPFPPLIMNKLLRGLLAGYGAKKLGGGCFSTILVFIVLWVLLGQCGATLASDAQLPANAPAVVSLATVPAW